MKIDINKYLTEEDKKEIAISEFTSLVRENVISKFKEEERLSKKERMPDYERVISNAVFYYLEGEIDTLIGTDVKSLIKEKVKKTILNKNYNYSLFRSKGMFDSEDSPGQLVIKKAVEEHSETIKSKFKSKIDDLIDNLERKDIHEIFTEAVYTIIEDKLTNKQN